MAKAYACDRCGELFRQFEDSVTVVLESDREFNVNFATTQVYILLCPKCRAGFQKWWDEDAVHKTTEPQHKLSIETLYDHEEDKDENSI